jgi:hypothetical protein
MASLFEVSHSMPIASRAIIELSSTAQISTDNTKPKIRLQIAVIARGKVLGCYNLGLRLIKVPCVRACMDLLFPLRSLVLEESRLVNQYRIHNRLKPRLQNLLRSPTSQTIHTSEGIILHLKISTSFHSNSQFGYLLLLELVFTLPWHFLDVQVDKVI